MRTLYLRNVPDPVVKGLESLAAREGMSVSAFATRELSNVAKRARNAALLASLPDVPITTEQIIDTIDEGRSER